MRTHLYFTIVAAFLALGCGNSKLASVSGKVTLDGKPLANARITFQPIGTGTAYPGGGSFGKTNANGEYTLSLIDGNGSGAFVGKHRVAISCLPEDQSTNPQADRPKKTPPDIVPAKYNFQSQLECEVAPGRNRADWQLQSK
jgi:hypothetical protein